MDVLTPTDSGYASNDPKQLLIADVERARAECDDLDRQIATDAERLAEIREALDTMVNAAWRDVYGQQQRMRDRENITDALSFGWTGSYRLVCAGGAIALFVGAIYALQVVGAFIALGLYVVAALVGYVVARDQCLAPVRKARASYLGADGKDVRFVAFARYEPGLNHPLIGYDGPTAGKLEDRAWKIPGVRDKDAMLETFIEVIDERRSNVLLTRFPDRKPTLVHADLENPFIRTYGVFFQRALERHLPTVEKHANDYREIVQRYGKRKELDDRLRALEAELHEFEGTAALVRSLMLPAAARDRLLRQVVLFRLGDPAVRRGLFICAGERTDLTEVAQALSRAAAATLLKISFSQIKIGYVGQGASTVARIFDQARRTRSIVFIDEADKFFASTSASQYEAMRREVEHALFKEWDALEGRTDVWVVAGASSREELDPAALAHFGVLLDFTPTGAEGDAQLTTVIGDDGAPAELPRIDVALSAPVVARNRLLAAMFAHVETMESQGIVVPRAVLIAGPSRDARQTVVNSLADQTSLPLIESSLEQFDEAIAHARSLGRALVVVDIPEYGDPGVVAHFAMALDAIADAREPIFVLACAGDAVTLDPELRLRFPELVDLTELDGPARREALHDLLGARPLDFELETAMTELEARTEGMTYDHLKQFVDEAGRRAALRAIDGGSPDHVIYALADFEPYAPPAPATKDDEAAL
ncbi:MAG: AAA family ATPase [bacterium]|nr:AAA family ATPase [bacterium]